MGTFVSRLLIIVAIWLAACVMVLLVEIVAALVALRWQRCICMNRGLRKRVAVLVPAHNESSGLLPTIADIHSQLLSGDRILVVADNCSDDTANVAMAAGAEVVERADPTKHGKGYALHCGIRHLSMAPPEVVIIVDADCRLSDGAIDQLASACALTGRPVQALYLMTAPVKSAINHQVAEFAWRVKNWLRPLGLQALKLPCQLMGTGMAFPWDVISSADLGNGRIVEDLWLGLELASAGHPPVFCSSARVTSQFASSLKGTTTQRKRWEHGHIHTIVKTAPILAVRAILNRNWNLLALTFDLAVPPLSLLAILILVQSAVSGFAAFFSHSFAAFAVSIADLLAFTLAVSLAWLECGRDVLPHGGLLLINSYVIKKLGLYRQIFSGRMDSRWNRTDRTTPE